LVSYLLNIKQNLTYIRFGIILTQFNINFSRQEHNIELRSQVSAYTPLHFSFTVIILTDKSGTFGLDGANLQNFTPLPP